MEMIAAPLTQTSSAFLTDDPEELIRIHEPAVNLCVWQRTVAPLLEQFIDRVVLPLPIHSVVTLAADDLNLDQLLRDVPVAEGYASFRADVEGLAHRYIHLTDAERITIKLESLGGTLCERFHVDWVQLRLLCSYAGPGTQWLTNDDLDRRKLGPGSGGLADEASGLIRPGGTIRALDRFAVGLMKGEEWPGNRGRGLVHRSPRISGNDVRRLLLKIESARQDLR